MRESRLDNDTLLTERLSLRRPVPGDIDAILAIHSDPRALTHNPSDALADRTEAEDLYARWQEHWARYGFGYWVIRRRGDETPIGFCGVKTMRLGKRPILNLFYRLAPEAWGAGIATEAACAVVAWAKEHRPEPVVARVRPQNSASQRVAVKAGLVRAEHLDAQGYDGPDWIYTT